MASKSAHQNNILPIIWIVSKVSGIIHTYAFVYHQLNRFGIITVCLLVPEAFSAIRPGIYLLSDTYSILCERCSSGTAPDTETRPVTGTINLFFQKHNAQENHFILMEPG